ncbi:MAG TPA: hypothetical protein VJ697_04055 [Nitrososphaeraceae archaeon]|nr:hypothetical protein [Nitrososphaeraceae archaeon]
MRVLKKTIFTPKAKSFPEKIFYKKEITLQDPQISKIVISDRRYVELERKIDSITNGSSRQYLIKY